MSTPSDHRRYEVVQVLGRGGFGTVYRAKMLSSGGFRKDVALKVLNPELQAQEDIVRRLRDEARMLGLLRHRAIVQVDGLVRLEDRWAIVMEFVEGASLREILDQGPIPTGVALEICEEVAAALDVAFSRPNADGTPLRLLHRDIKPGNLQITAQGEVKLLDFGVARAEFGGREAKTTSLIFGSLAYLAPERMDFEDTHQGDVYALAVTLFECLTGSPPEKASINPRKHKEQLETARQKLLAKVGDPEVVRLVLDGLAYEPTERPDARTFERRARDLRRAWPQPWLREWAEGAVPRAFASRTVDPAFAEDHWSGTVLDESTGADATLALDALPPGQVEGRPQTPNAPPNTNAPQTSKPPSPKPMVVRKERASPMPAADDLSTGVRRRRSTSWLGWIAGISVTLLLLVVGAVVLVPVLTGVGVVAALRGSGLWDDAWHDAVGESMIELEPQVRACSPPERVEEAIDILRRAQSREGALRTGILELGEFELLVEDVVRDQLLTVVEIQKLERELRRIQAD